jgi:hypothetical protein
MSNKRSRRNPEQTAYICEQIAKLRAEGKSLLQIGKLINMDKSLVQYYDKKGREKKNNKNQ